MYTYFTLVVNSSSSFIDCKYKYVIVYVSGRARLYGVRKKSDGSGLLTRSNYPLFRQWYEYGRVLSNRNQWVSRISRRIRYWSTYIYSMSNEGLTRAITNIGRIQAYFTGRWRFSRISANLQIQARECTLHFSREKIPIFARRLPEWCFSLYFSTRMKRRLNIQFRILLANVISTRW